MYVGGADVLVLAATEQRREGGEEARRIAERAVFVQGELVEVLPQEDDDLGPRQDAHVGREPELQRVIADDPVAERVERGDGCVRVAVRDELVDPHGHLVGGLVREGQGQDLGWLRPTARDQPGDPPGDDLRLAGPRSRDHEQRPFAMRHRAELLRVQSTEQGVHADRAGPGSDRRVHDRDELAPGRDLIEGCGLPAPGREPDAGHGSGRRWVGDGGHVRSIAGPRDT